MRKTKYAETIAFVNRKTELRFLQEWADKPPKDILFIHGPKSSGKTTLLYKFTDSYLDKKQVDVKFLNLRQILIANYQDFIKAFFEVDFSQSKEDVKEKRKYNLGVFKLSVEVLKGLESKSYDPFKLMKQELENLHENGKRPIIIIDELQALEDIYINGQRELLKELFNFFVSMTKELHLCHIIISSSDGYFIERIYQDSKLSKCADFFEVDYLQKDDVVYWLNNLRKESGIENLLLTETQINKIWDYFGGSVWEINNFLSALIVTAKDKKIKNIELINEAKKRIYRYRSDFFSRAGFKTNRIELYKLLNKILQKKSSFDIIDLSVIFNENLWKEDDLNEELIELVKNNLMLYNPTKAEYKPQGRSALLGLQLFCDEWQNRQ